MFPDGILVRLCLANRIAHAASIQDEWPLDLEILAILIEGWPSKVA
jgi:hypothetical protein